MTKPLAVTVVARRFATSLWFSAGLYSAMCLRFGAIGRIPGG
jgi:hypothetical protein